MGDQSDRLIELIELVADGGSAVDWNAIERAAPDESLRAAIRELRTIAGVGAVHATQIADASATPARAAAAAPAEAPSVDPDEPTGPILEIAPTQTWGNFELIRLIGEGSYGEVYEAIDSFLQHKVALKLMKPVVERARILQEARMLVRLRHPNVVVVHGADVRRGRVGFWMDFIDGWTLSDVVAREKVRSAAEAAVIGQDLCRALAAVHSVGIVHRDIKAQNVMRESGTGRIVLMDFGAGEPLDPSVPRTGRPVGTPLYLAPELFDGGHATQQSDIYALGVLLFYLVTGSFPVQGDDSADLRQRHLRGQRRRLADVRPDLPDAFVRVVETMIAPDPARRYDSATSAREALERVVAPSGPIPVPEPMLPIGLRRIFAWAVGLVIAVALTLVLGFLSTAAYNLSFGRTGEFGDESPLQWLLRGEQLMLSPAVMIGAYVLGFTALMVLGRVVGRFSRRVRTAASRLTDACAAFARSHELEDPNLLLQLVSCAGVVVFGILVVVFWNLVSVPGTHINDAPAARLAEIYAGRDIAPAGRLLEICLFLYGLAGFAVYRIASRTGKKVSAPVLGMAVAVAFLALLLLRAFPYRIYVQDKAVRVDLGDQRCYEIGRTEQQVLLHCADVMPPRNLVVSRNDQRLRPRGVIESVFTPAAESSPMR